MLERGPVLRRQSFVTLTLAKRQLKDFGNNENEVVIVDFVKQLIMCACWMATENTSMITSPYNGCLRKNNLSISNIDIQRSVTNTALICQRQSICRRQWCRCRASASRTKVPGSSPVISGFRLQYFHKYGAGTGVCID